MRRLAILWLAMVLCFAGFAAPCLAQDSPSPPDIPLLTQRSEAGDPEAMVALGEAYLDGNGVKRDLDEAIRLLAPMARTNDANALYLLSFALRERNKPGDRLEALRYAVSALSFAKQGRQNAGTEYLQANIQSQLGFVYEQLTRFDEAIIAYQAALRIFERKLKSGHPQVAGAHMNLANGLAGAGRQEESLAATEKALQILASLVSDDDELLGSLYKNKAISLIGLARYSEALDALDKAQDIYLKRGRAESLAGILSTRSRTYNLLGRNEEALSTAQSALVQYKKASSPDPRTLAATQGILGLAYQGLRRFKEARAEYRAAAQILEQNYGPDDRDIMHPLINLGNVDDELGQFEDALTSYQRAFNLILDKYGTDHLETAAMLGRLGNTSRKLRRFDAALDNGLQALLIQSEATGGDIDNQRYTFRLLARTLADTGHRATAILFAKQAVNTHQAVRIRNSNLSEEMRAALGQSFQPSYRLLSDLLLGDGQYSEAQFVGGLLKREEFYEFTRNGRTSEGRDIEPGSARLTDAELKF